jgi:hypothetical protein
MDNVYDAKAVEEATLATLKDFQLETVKRVDALFRPFAPRRSSFVDR